MACEYFERKSYEIKTNKKLLELTELSKVAQKVNIKYKFCIYVPNNKTQMEINYKLMQKLIIASKNIKQGRRFVQDDRVEGRALKIGINLTKDVKDNNKMQKIL